MPKLRLLHLSDFHVGKDEYGQQRLFTYILNEVQTKVDAGLGPDMVLITGDIANKGRAEEYQEFNEQFLKKLETRVSPACVEHIYIVPGNHDVDRNQAQVVDTYTVLGRVPIFLDPTDDGLRQRLSISDRFRAYTNAYPTHTNNGAEIHWLFSEQGAWICCSQVNDYRVGILGLNTAWFACSDEDRHKLTAGKNIIETGLEKIQACDLRLVLGHHPLDWWRDEDVNPVRALFGRYNVLYLHGHMHKTQSHSEEGSGQLFRRLQAGACFQAREDERWVNRLLWYEVDTAAYKLYAEPLRWSRDNQAWVIDSEAFPPNCRQPGTDRWEFMLPGEPSGSSNSVTTSIYTAPTPSSSENFAPSTRNPLVESKSKQKLALVNALLECSTMQDRQKRDAVVAELRDEIRNSIQRSSANNVDVHNITARCFEFYGGIEELIQKVRDFEGDSIPMKKVYHIMRSNREAPDNSRNGESVADESCETHPDVEFVNRDEEVIKIVNSERFTKPRRAIHAPAGYGKTWLLKRLKREFRERDWLVAYADLNKNSTIPDITNELLTSIGSPKELSNIKTVADDFGGELRTAVWEQQGSSKQGIVLLIDLEAPPEEIAIFPEKFQKWLYIVTENFYLHEDFSIDNPKAELRTVIAGRFFETIESGDVPFFIYSLTPFTYEYVLESARKYLRNIRLTAGRLTELASALLYYTGGHPGCMSQILKLYRSTKGMVPSRFFEIYKDEINEYVLVALKQILEGMPAEIRQLLLALSPYRKLSYAVLRDLIRHDPPIVKWSGSYVNLADRLTQTYLLSWNKGRTFIKDDISRRVMSLDLRYSEALPFGKRCEWSRSLYQKRLEDDNERELKAHWAVEYLYQSLQAYAPTIQSPETRTKLRRELLGDISKTDFLSSDTTLHVCLSRLVHNRNPREQIGILHRIIEDDWEFKFTLNYFLRDEIYEDKWFNLLCGKIQAFLNQSNERLYSISKEMTDDNWVYRS